LESKNNYIIAFSSLSMAEEITPKAALLKLQEGYARYVSGERTYPMLDSTRREDTAKNGQFPFATIMGCSDSRVPIEHIFDVGIGDIFPIRVAGNVSDIDEIGSIEYGIEHLHTPIMVVLGHTGCGAVTAVVRGDHVTGSIPELVDNIIPTAEQAKEEMGSTFSAELVNEAVKLNVYQSIEDLFRGSEAAVELVEAGELEVIGGIYNLETGGIEWLGKHPQESSILRSIDSEEYVKDGNKFPTIGIVGSLLSPLLLLFAFLIFISKKTGIISLKTKGKLIVSALFMVIAIAVPELIGLSLMGDPEFHISVNYVSLLIKIPLISVFLFGIAVAGSISNGFREHLQKLKIKYGKV
jgi:carbonic anhydrase